MAPAEMSAQTDSPHKHIRRYTVAVDFDGVLHQYRTPCVNAHTIPDSPVPGALAWLHETLQHFDVVIYSTRCRTWRGRRAIRRWMRENASAWWYETGVPSDRGLEDVRLSYSKPIALIYIDDRAWRFEGRFPTRKEIHQAQPWKVALNERGGAA